MKVLVTGASGFVGAHTAAALQDAGHELRLLVLPTREASLSVIDVRDMAEVHRRLLDPGPSPARVMCGGARLTMVDLQGHVGELTGRRFPISPLPPGALRSMGRFMDRLAAVVPFEPALTEEAMTLITTWPGTDDNAPADLGMTYRPVRETLATALEAWLAAGLITRRQRGATRGNDTITRRTP